MRHRIPGWPVLPWRFLALAAAFLLMGVMASTTLVLGEGEGKPPVGPASGADDDQKVNVKRLEEKLDEILAVQESTLARFDQIMEDLRIVKIRVSR